MTAIAGIPKAVILDQWGERPVFHQLAGGKYRITGCGIELDHPGRQRWLARPIIMRRDHVEKFARPCMRCF